MYLNIKFTLYYTSIQHENTIDIRHIIMTKYYDYTMLFNSISLNFHIKKLKGLEQQPGKFIYFENVLLV